MLGLWELQHLDLAVFLWDLKTVILKPKQNVCCVLLTSKSFPIFGLNLPSFWFLCLMSQK